MGRYIALDTFLFLIVVAVLAMIILSIISLFTDYKAKHSVERKKKGGEKK